MPDEMSSTSPIELATELTTAWLSNPNTRTTSEEVPAFLRRMHEAVVSLGTSAESGPAEEPTAEYTPATTARRSLSSADHIISMIDGKPYKTLRRHLSRHGLTPEQYRERYKLKSDYPMVAPSYSETRRAMAKKIGLGQKGRAARETSTPDAALARRARKPRAPKPE